MEPTMTVTQVVAAIERSFEKARAAEAAEEAKHKGRPTKHPLPSKEEAWEAFTQALVDQEIPVNDDARIAFEEWWRPASLSTAE